MNQRLTHAKACYEYLYRCTLCLREDWYVCELPEHKRACECNFGGPWNKHLCGGKIELVAMRTIEMANVPRGEMTMVRA